VIGQADPTWARDRIRVTEVKDLQDLLREGSSGPFLPTGTSTLLGRGNPPKDPVTLIDLSSLDRIVEYAHQDLTITVQAGVRLSDLAQTLQERNQWLPLVAHEHSPGTVGGLIGGDRSSPWSGALGSVRDHLLGVSFVDGQGSLIRGGGRVVKNVAGYDLMKLLTGSLGELGAVVEATFRVLPMAEAWSGVMLSAPEEGMCQDTVFAGPRWLPTGLWRTGDETSEELLSVFSGAPTRVDAQTRKARELWGEGCRLLDRAAIRDWVTRRATPDPPVDWRAWGGALPGFLATAPLVEVLGGGRWEVDLLTGRFGWVGRQLPSRERLATIRKALGAGEGHLHLDADSLDGMRWGCDPGGELPLWQGIKNAVDPHSRWARGRLPGGV